MVLNVKKTTTIAVLDVVAVVNFWVYLRNCSRTPVVPRRSAQHPTDGT